MESLREETMLAEKCHFSNILLFLSLFFYFLKCCLIAGIFCLWLGKRYVHEPPQKNKEKQQLTIKNLSWAGFTK